MICIRLLRWIDNVALRRCALLAIRRLICWVARFGLVTELALASLAEVSRQKPAHGRWLKMTS